MSATKQDKDMTWLLLALLAAALGLVLFALAQGMGSCIGVIEKADGGTVPMKCHWTMIAVKYLGLGLALLALGQCCLKNRDGRRYTACALIIVTAAALLLTTSAGIGVCAMEGMRCRSTVLWLRIDMLLLLLVAVIQLVRPVPRPPKPSKMF